MCTRSSGRVVCIGIDNRHFLAGSYDTCIPNGEVADGSRKIMMMYNVNRRFLEGGCVTFFYSNCFTLFCAACFNAPLSQVLFLPFGLMPRCFKSNQGVMGIAHSRPIGLQFPPL